jgi:hypothetical protein
MLVLVGATCTFLVIIILAFLLGVTLCVIIPAVLSIILCGAPEGVHGGKTKSLNEAIDQLGYFMDGVIKSYTDKKIIYDHAKVLSSDPNLKPQKPASFVNINKKYTAKIKKIYEREGKLDIFPSDLDITTYYMPFDEFIVDKPAKGLVKKYQKERRLVDRYPHSTNYRFVAHNISRVEYTPLNQKEFDDLLEGIMESIVLIYLRGLKTEEEDKIEKSISKFMKGNMTKPEMTIHFNDGKTKQINRCTLKDDSCGYNSIYKRLHWGQRKLLLSEIDFFNRVALEMGKDAFKSEKISVLYPGSAHGNHLMILMEMYPNIIFYLWDPARYNNVLYLAEYLRRGLKIDFPHTKHEKIMAEKYVDRIFINMELDDATFMKYHDNSRNRRFVDNYRNNYGFFMDSSIEYFHKYRELKNNKTKILLISDIRMYEYQNILSFYYKNYIPFSDIKILRYINDKMALKDYHRDMKLQQDWFEKCKAEYGLLKFKLKMTKSFLNNLQEEYMDGDILLQAWAPVASTETRLFVSPKHTKKAAYYNTYNYEKSLRFFNTSMRLNKMNDVKLSDLEINTDNKNINIGNIWESFLPAEKIGMDAILETFIVYDYLTLYKDETIKVTDIMLVISDITQTLLNMANHTNILGYFDNQADPIQILNKRKGVHRVFNRRLDFNSRNDNNVCTIDRRNRRY